MSTELINLISTPEYALVIQAPRNGEPFQVCNTCSLPKELSFFAENCRGKHGKFQCRRCNILKNLYGINHADYMEMWTAQKGVCRICRRQEKALGRYGTVKALAVDHDHRTRKIRGLLCSPCNIGLGDFSHSVSVLYSAIEYLKETA